MKSFEQPRPLLDAEAARPSLSRERGSHGEPFLTIGALTYPDHGGHQVSGLPSSHRSAGRACDHHLIRSARTQFRGSTGLGSDLTAPDIVLGTGKARVGPKAPCEQVDKGCIDLTLGQEVVPGPGE